MKCDEDKLEDLMFWRLYRWDVMSVPFYVSWRKMTYPGNTFRTYKILYVFGLRVAAWRIND